jgi:hypothetical protein
MIFFNKSVFFLEKKSFFYLYFFYKIKSIELTKVLSDLDVWKWPLLEVNYELNIYVAFY